MNTSDLIQPTHLQRRALIYVRQSSPSQVINHRESKRLQYALKDRALERGWRKCDVQVIDRDLGLTGSTAADRPGFQELVSLVSLGQIGIVFAYDATRLARNCTDWYQLLDLCSLRQCLVGDQDGIYDPATPNGRLILGLKGMIAELELHTIRARLQAGKISKASRGEMAIPLPTGLVRLESGQVVKDPDREIQDRITLVFRTLLAQKSLAKVLGLLREKQLKLPRRDKWGDLHWKPVTRCALSDIVHNPAYAGAYVWGRSRWVKSPKTGRQQQVLLPREQWRICLHDHFPAYVSWPEFERIEAMLQDNYAEYKRRRTRGVPREGKCLLQGIAYCGECGHKLGVQYKKSTLYLCHFFRTHDHPGPPCQRLPADLVDEQVVHWFFEALSAAEIDLSARVLAEGDRTREKVVAARRQEVERLQYQVRLADRQFQRSDPDNRLVTAELERRWEEALCACQEAEHRLREEEAHAPCLAIPADLLEQLQDLGPHVSELWQQKLFQTSQKKALLRTLIDKVVLHRVATDRLCIRVVWRGGQTTTTELRVPVYSFARLSDGKQIEEVVVRLAREGQTDEQIAAVLTAEGHRAPRNQEINAGMVQRLRLAKRVSRYRLNSRPLRPGYLTLIQIAEKLDVSYSRIYRYLFEGKLRATKDPSANCYLFPDKPATMAQFRQLLNGEVSQLCF